MASYARVRIRESRARASIHGCTAHQGSDHPARQHNANSHNSRSNRSSLIDSSPPLVHRIVRYDRARAFLTRAEIVDGDVNKTRRYVRPLTSAVTLRAENQREVNGSGAESVALRPGRERAVCDAEALCTFGHAEAA